MKSVGLMTMHRICNCGSCLQTLATVKIVDSLGYKCTVIDFKYPAAYHMLHGLGNEFGKGGFVRRTLNRLGLRKLARTVKGLYCQHRDLPRLKAFLEEIPHTKTVGMDTVTSIPPFDIYLTGSDQTWNARYLAHDYSFLLDFAPANVPKIAYSASFGVKVIPEAYRKDYAALLSRYAAISVRESSGIGLVAELTGKQAKLVLDPTLLLAQSDWQPYASHPASAEGRFIFCYLLPYFDPGEWVIDLIAALAKRLDAKVVCYSDALYLDAATKAGFKVLSGCLPYKDFLGYMDKACFVVTNSFHGTAFSVDFHKEFYSVTNPAATADNRVLSLLASIGLSQRGIPAGSPIPEKIAAIDHKAVEERLDALRLESKTFLKSALEGRS